MKIKLVSTLNHKYWKKTGQYTVAHWKKNIPTSWQIWCHDTPNIPANIDRYLEPSAEKRVWFEEAERLNHELTLPPGFMKEWYKFYHKSFAQWESFFIEPNGIMIWCDADVKFKKPLTLEIVKRCLDGKFCAYLGRDRVNTTHPLFIKEYGQYKKLTPETCFIVYDLNHSIAKDFFTEFKNVYLSMELFNLMSWCDAGAFINTVEKFPEEFFNDITKHLPATPLPLNISMLDEYLEHWIGTRNKKERRDVRGQQLKDRYNNYE